MFERTVKAIIKEETDGWEVIKRAADDCDRAGVEFTAAPTIAALRDELLANGKALELSSCKSRLGVASYWIDGTSRQRETLEQVSWSVVRVFWGASFSQEAACSIIRSAKGRLTHVAALDAVRTPRNVRAGAAQHLDDAEVVGACETIIRAQHEREAGKYKPGPQAALLLDLFAASVGDWDEAAMKELR